VKNGLKQKEKVEPYQPHKDDVSYSHAENRYGNGKSNGAGNTSGLLCVWGQFAQEIGLIFGIKAIPPLAQKTYDHSPQPKVL
jgi:hypothetical protein